jgi:aspartate/methionine/tyrosine aminotransferase
MNRSLFSSRLPSRLTPNALSEAVGSARAEGRSFLDLTETNPTAVGLDYSSELLRPLADPRGLRYEPDPLGLPLAREAVAASFDAAVQVNPSHIVLTASTSEAYAFLFRLLCNPGDEVLIPQPSYPLFDLLTRLDAVQAVPYRLDPAAEWRIDRESVTRGLSTRTRAMLLVSPNNPTGSMLRAADRDWLVELASERKMALIADEVFADFPLTPPPDAVSLAGADRTLVFVLGGLSKSVGLPQLKLAWIAASGPAPALDEALARLTVIADTYLSVSTPVQLSAASLLDAGRTVRQAIRARLAQNLNTLRDVVRAHPFLTLIEPAGGWSAVLRVPAILPEEELVVRLLTGAGVLVHPGYFFDFDREAFLVMSLLPDPNAFRRGCERIGQTLEAF